jgi:ribose transport system substrate-binding protein
VDEVLRLELPMAGPLPRSRLTGVLAGIREILPKILVQKAHFINDNRRFENSRQATRKYLQHNKTKYVLIGALNDPSCLGALQAFEESGPRGKLPHRRPERQHRVEAKVQRQESRLVG